MTEPANPALRQQLVAMARRDQELRQRWTETRRAADAERQAELQQEINEVDHEHAAALKAIISQHGWPGISLVGEAGADAAWLLAQHADHDLGFQRDVLALLEPLLGTGEIDPTQHAYLHDRVAVAERRPQRFGTQFVDGRHPAPIEDEEHVDERRRAVGLDAMADYTAHMRRLSAPKK